MARPERGLRASLSVLLLVAALLFGIGTLIERGRVEHREPATASDEARAGSRDVEGAGHEAEEAADSGEVAALGEKEKVFGINPESGWLVAAAIALSVAAAAAVWLTSWWPVYAGTLAFALVFAAFDARETVHQFNEGNGDIVAIAVALTVIHLATAALATVLLGRRTGRLATV